MLHSYEVKSQTLYQQLKHAQDQISLYEELGYEAVSYWYRRKKRLQKQLANEKRQAS